MQKIQQEIPIFFSPVSAGFPSPATEAIEKNLDLNEFLIKHPAATYFVRVDGYSMIGAGINNGDILIVDKALEPFENAIIIASINGEFTVKRFKKIHDQPFLFPENPHFRPIKITNDSNFEVWGVVTYVIHQTK